MVSIDEKITVRRKLYDFISNYLADPQTRDYFYYANKIWTDYDDNTFNEDRTIIISTEDWVKNGRGYRADVTITLGIDQDELLLSELIRNIFNARSDMIALNLEIGINHERMYTGTDKTILVGDLGLEWIGSDSLIDLEALRILFFVYVGV